VQGQSGSDFRRFAETNFIRPCGFALAGSAIFEDQITQLNRPHDIRESRITSSGKVIVFVFRLKLQRQRKTAGPRRPRSGDTNGRASLLDRESSGAECLRYGADSTGGERFSARSAQTRFCFERIGY
jgi:hypothetical protein